MYEVFILSNSAEFSDMFFDYYIFTYLVDVFAVLFGVLMFAQFILRALYTKSILKFIVGIVWIIYAFVNTSIFTNLFGVINFSTNSVIVTILVFAFVILISLDMFLHSKQGKIVGTACLLAYIILYVSNLLLTSAKNDIIFGTLGIAIPVFLILIYFGLPDKQISQPKNVFTNDIRINTNK